MADDSRILALLTDEQYTMIGDEDPLLAQCVLYLNLCETQVDETQEDKIVKRFMTQEEIAASMGMSYNTLLKRRHEWDANLILERARTVFSAIKRENINVVNQRMLQEWPTVLDKAFKMMMNTNDAKTFLMFANFIKQEAIAPLLADKPVSSKNEEEYLRRRREALSAATQD